MPREIIQPRGVADPRPRFAQVVKHGKTVYVSGQTPVDADGNLVGKGNIEAQARQVLENITKCLEAAGGTFDDVVKINVYSTDLDAHLPVIAKLRQEFFSKGPVASTTVQVSRLVHPDWLIEIEAVAVLD